MSLNTQFCSPPRAIEISTNYPEETWIEYKSKKRGRYITIWALDFHFVLWAAPNVWQRLSGTKESILFSNFQWVILTPFANVHYLWRWRGRFIYIHIIVILFTVSILKFISACKYKLSHAFHEISNQPQITTWRPTCSPRVTSVWPLI